MRGIRVVKKTPAPLEPKRLAPNAAALGGAHGLSRDADECLGTCRVMSSSWPVAQGYDGPRRACHDNISRLQSTPTASRCNAQAAAAVRPAGCVATDGITKSDGRINRSIVTRKKIVDALTALVFEGHITPTAEQVAQRANVGLHTVFRHFDDMDSLCREVMRLGVQALLATRPQPA